MKKNNLVNNNKEGYSLFAKMTGTSLPGWAQVYMQPIRSKTWEKHTEKEELSTGTHNSPLLHSHLVRKKNLSSPGTIDSRHNAAASSIATAREQKKKNRKTEGRRKDKRRKAEGKYWSERGRTTSSVLRQSSSSPTINNSTATAGQFPPPLFSSSPSLLATSTVHVS